MEASLRQMTSEDLRMVLRWRNHSDVRRFMFSQCEISEDEHLEWFDQVSIDSLSHVLIFEHLNQPAGFISIREVVPGKIAEWGFYTAPEANKGIGRLLGELVLEYVFGTRRFHKLCGKALGLNEPSIKFHNKLGFTMEGCLKEQYFDGQEYQDIICFGLLARDWERVTEKPNEHST